MVSGLLCVYLETNHLVAVPRIRDSAGPKTGYSVLCSIVRRSVDIWREPLERLASVDPFPQALRLLRPPVHAHVLKKRLRPVIESGRYLNATYSAIKVGWAE
jgi:hypothetical protein